MQHVYLKLIEEEHEEWIEDFFNMNAPEYQELKELADLLYVTAGYLHQLGSQAKKALIYSPNEIYSDSITNLIEMIALGKVAEKPLRQLIYCIYGYAKGMDWDIEEAYNRVHKSNMTKLDDEGNPVYREDGKVLKGPNYKPPFLEDLTRGI